MAVPNLLFDNEAWVINRPQEKTCCIQAIQKIKIFRTIKGCRKSDRLGNVGVREKLNITVAK